MESFAKVKILYWIPQNRRKLIIVTIISDMIINSFLCMGIIYSPNQKDDIFTAWRKMNEEVSLIENDLGDDFVTEETKAKQEDMNIGND